MTKGLRMIKFIARHSIIFLIIGLVVCRYNPYIGLLIIGVAIESPILIDGGGSDLDEC